jgi:hypothetical protein
MQAAGTIYFSKHDGRSKWMTPRVAHLVWGYVLNTIHPGQQEELI